MAFRPCYVLSLLLEDVTVSLGCFASCFQCLLLSSVLSQEILQCIRITYLIYFDTANHKTPISSSPTSGTSKFEAAETLVEIGVLKSEEWHLKIIAFFFQKW